MRRTKVDYIMTAAQELERRFAFVESAARAHPWAASLSFITLASLLGGLFRCVRFPEATIVLLYTAAVLLTSRFTPGYKYGVGASVAATCAFNYFFTEPYYTLRVYDPSYFITFGVMTATSIMTSALTTKAIQNADERYRANLLRAISHDLRTPLSGIMGTAEVLIGMSDEGDERRALAKGIYRDAEWLHSLVENILSLTRLQDGGLAIKKQPEAVEEVVEGAVSRIAKRAPERDITVSIPDELLLVPMDAKLVEQMLINLLDNAVKHTAPEAEISVRVWKAGGEACFSVADRGAGISDADMPNIFKTFYTVSARGADSQRGVGLGLAICDAIVTAHGGGIAARNRSDGPGAEFTFTLPMGEERENGK